MDSKSEEDLLGIVSALHFRSDLRLIKSVGLQQAMDAVHGLGDIVVLKRGAERELRRAVHLGPIGRLQHLSLHRDSTQKPGVLGDKADDHALARRLGLHDDVVEASGGE